MHVSSELTFAVSGGFACPIVFVVGRSALFCVDGIFGLFAEERKRLCKGGDLAAH